MSDKPIRVLLIDDEPHLLFGLNAVMKRAGFEVLTAANGKAGLDHAREDHPDIIVCDVMMPPPNGLQLKQMLAKDPVTASIPFIFLTARTNLSDKLVGLSSGADDYLTKPFQVEELIERIRAILRRYETGRQQGLAEAEQKIDELRRFLHMTAQLVAENGQMVEQMEFANDHGEAWHLYSRESFELQLDSLTDPGMFPFGIVVFQVNPLQPTEAPIAEQLIRRAAQVLKDAIDAEQLIFKTGVNEFVVLVPNASDLRIEQTLTCVKTELERHNSADPGHPLDLKIGIAVGEMDSRLSDVLRQAEAMMNHSSADVAAAG